MINSLNTPISINHKHLRINMNVTPPSFLGTFQTNNLAWNHLGLEDTEAIMTKEHSIAKVVILHLEGVGIPI